MISGTSAPRAASACAPSASSQRGAWSYRRLAPPSAQMRSAAARVQGGRLSGVALEEG